MTITHDCVKKLAQLPILMNKKTKLATGSCFRRWVSHKIEFAEEELFKGKKFAALWGNGDYGRLGLGNLHSEWRPNPISPSAFGNQSLKDIACGGAHTLFLTENGDVYATGLNDYGQLGISDSQNYTTVPLRVSGVPKHVIQISSGSHHSAAITVDGELYIWGKNSNGQLGLGKKAEKIIPVPSKVESLGGLTIKAASLGFGHSIAVTEKGEVLSWGEGESGRLGHGHESSIFGFQKTSSEYTPRLIKGLEGVKVKSVSAGMMHSACISGRPSQELTILLSKPDSCGQLCEKECKTWRKILHITSILGKKFCIEKCNKSCEEYKDYWGILPEWAMNLPVKMQL